MRDYSFLTARVLVGLLLFSVGPALAAGVNLRWDNCYSDGGVVNKTFACDTNAGSERLVMSFVLDSPKTDVSGMEIRLIFVSAGATVPAWWQFRNPGSCRSTSLTFSTTLPPGSANCLDWGSGNEIGGIGAYTLQSPGGLTTATAVLAAAVPSSSLASLNANQEYFIGSLGINHAKTVGTGACGGCDVPMCIVLDRLRVTSPIPSSDLTLRDPAFGTDSNFARWQNGRETNVQIVNCEGQNFGCYHSYSCVLSTTPVRSSTWGQVKSLYR